MVLEKYSKAVFKENAPTWRELPRRFQSRARGDERARGLAVAAFRIVARASCRSRSAKPASLAPPRAALGHSRSRRAHLLTLRVPSARVLTKAPTSTRDEAPVRGEERQAAAAVDRRRHRLGARNPRPHDRSARRTTADLKSLDFPRDVVDFLSSRRSALTSRSLLARRLQLDKRGATIDDKIKRLDLELAKHREILKKARTPAAQEAAKRRALTVLKQKRMYEGQREQLYSQQLNLEQVSFATQSARDTAVQVQAMQASAKELKAQFKTKAFDIDKIDALNDEMADLMDQANEIQEVLGRNYNVPDDIDEDELLGELDALEDLMAEEETGEEVPSYLQDEALPDAPDLQPLPAAGAGGMPAEPAAQQQQRVEEAERTTAQ